MTLPTRGPDDSERERLALIGTHKEDWKPLVAGGAGLILLGGILFIVSDRVGHIAHLGIYLSISGLIVTLSGACVVLLDRSTIRRGPEVFTNEVEPALRVR